MESLDGHIHLRATQPHETGVVADLLVDGLWDNATWGMIDLHEKHPDAERFVFKANAWLMLGNDTYLICHDDEVIGHVFITKPGALVVPSAWNLLRASWSVPFRFGWDFTKRLFDLFDSVGKQTDPIVKALQPAVMLERFVIKSQWRGRGVGRYVLDTFVKKDRSRVVLTTQTQRNVRFYERAGFRVVEHQTLRTGYGRECESWVMAYDAPTAAE